MHIYETIGGQTIKGTVMLLLSGIFNEIEHELPEQRAARRAEWEYIGCVIATLLFLGVLFLVFALTV